MTNPRNPNKTDRYHNKRFISLVRQSNDTDGTTSTEAQCQWMRQEGEARGMGHVEDLILDGVTGSLPGNRQDIEDLLQRKRERDDFDVLLIQRCDRLTRGGSDHAGWLHHEAAKVGIEILYPGDSLPEGSAFQGTFRALKFDAAQDQARATAQRSVQGRLYSLNQGRSCYTGQTPYGCDRLYLSADDKPLFTIRNLDDGRQQKLHPETGVVIDSYGHVGGGSRGHYRKQREEKPRIVPGDPAKAAVVRDIFEWHYMQKLGGRRIAVLLNDRGIPSPRGKRWSQRQVESIYENPLYCGVALGQRVSQGIYYTRGAGKPEELNHEPKVLATCRHSPRRRRPPQEWVWHEEPWMAEFLPKALREQALPEIKQVHLEGWERSQDPTRPTRSTSKHKCSEYILTGLLVAKQDGAPLTGVLCGKVGKKIRKYRHPKARQGYPKGSLWNNYIRGPELEATVLGLIAELVADAPYLRQRVMAAIHEQRPDGETQLTLAKLREQRQQVADQVQLIVRTLDDASLADAKPELERLGHRRRTLEQQIAEKEQAVRYVAEDPEELADRVVHALASLGTSSDALSPTARRELVQAFVEKVEVDMASKAAEVSLVLPPWALARTDQKGRLAPNSPSPTIYETLPVLRIPLAYAHCRYIHIPGSTTQPPCYRCRRQAHAA